MRNYELMLIIPSNLEETKRTEVIKRFAKMASSDTVIDKMGMRKFATPINYKTEGFYVCLNFKAVRERVAEMTKVLRITDDVARFIFVEKTEAQIAADEERKKKRAAARAATAKEEAKGE